MRTGITRGGLPAVTTFLVLFAGLRLWAVDGPGSVGGDPGTWHPSGFGWEGGELTVNFPNDPHCGYSLEFIPHLRINGPQVQTVNNTVYLKFFLLSNPNDDIDEERTIKGHLLAWDGTTCVAQPEFTRTYMLPGQHTRKNNWQSLLTRVLRHGVRG